MTVVEAPEAFVAGEESAVVRRIEGGPALPRDRTVPTSISGVRGRPTLVNNVETLAHVALIARYGAHWFRSVGDPSEPGTMLVTLTGGPTTKLRARGADRNTPDGTRRAHGVTDPRAVRAVLVGGYHGSWIPGGEVQRGPIVTRGLAPLGASPGAGVVHALPANECGLARTADIVAYLAGRECPPMRAVPQRPAPTGPTGRRARLSGGSTTNA